MQPYWAAENEAFKSADSAAKAVRIAGMKVASFATDAIFGREAAKAAIEAFRAANEWDS